MSGLGRLPKEESFPNPYTGNAMMVVVNQGLKRRALGSPNSAISLADYRRLFGGEPRQLGAIAVMTDTDNTGGEGSRLVWRHRHLQPAILNEIKVLPAIRRAAIPHHDVTGGTKPPSKSASQKSRRPRHEGHSQTLTRRKNRRGDCA